MCEHAAPVRQTADDVLAFWMAAGHERWFEHDEAFDAAVRYRFATTYEEAAAGKLSAWENSPEGALALVIVLDQFPRNMFRGSARSFATDAMARTAADRAIVNGFDQQVAMPQRVFFYLPFEHSEALADQERSVALIAATGDADSLKWAELQPTSSGALAAFRTAMSCSAGLRRPRSKHSWIAAGSPADQNFISANRRR